MGNHYHLILKNGEGRLSRGMQWLGTSYTSYFNWKWGRSGHLFQGRFKSFIVDEESYLRQLILYVHRNPLRAGMVDRLSDYTWSSYNGIGYGRKCPPWLQVDSVLRLFGNSKKEFRSQVQSYSEEQSNLLEDLRQGFLLGSEKAAERLRSVITGGSPAEKQQRQRIGRAVGLERVMEDVTKAMKLSEEEVEQLKRPVRGIERPMRDLLIYLIWRQGSFRLSEIGNLFQVGYTSISNARIRGEAAIQQDKRLQVRLKKCGLEI